MKTIILAFSLLTTSVYAAPIKLSSMVVNFTPSRNAEVGRAFLGIRCLRSAERWKRFVNVQETVACSNFKVNGVSIGKNQIEKVIQLKELGPNQFQLDNTSIEYSTLKQGHVCLRLIATLESGSFQDPLDEWSLLSYCTVEKLPFPDHSEVYEHLRVKTLNTFKNSLYRPIPIIVN